MHATQRDTEDGVLACMPGIRLLIRLASNPDSRWANGERWTGGSPRTYVLYSIKYTHTYPFALLSENSEYLLLYRDNIEVMLINVEIIVAVAITISRMILIYARK